MAEACLFHYQVMELFGELRQAGYGGFGLVFPSLLFGAVRFSDICNVPAICFFGACLAALYRGTESLSSPIIAHMSNNGVAVVLQVGCAMSFRKWLRSSVGRLRTMEAAAESRGDDRSIGVNSARRAFTAICCALIHISPISPPLRVTDGWPH